VGAGQKEKEEGGHMYLKHKKGLIYLNHTSRFKKMCF